MHTSCFLSFAIKKSLLFFLIFDLSVCFNFNVFPQKESNNWYFGHNAGITFSTSPPTALVNGMLNTYEGCATISDKYGNLLFYTDGSTVWNKSHTVMDSGSGLKGHNSSTQSAIVVPKPGSIKIYYVFTVDAWDHQSLNGLQYSEIDMSMNGGLGKVINKNNLLVKPTSEKVTVARHSNRSDYWVITHGLKNNNFYSFLVTSGGINPTPVISSVGSYQDTNWKVIGYLKASSDNKKLVSAKYFNGELELFDFNNSNGIVSNAVLVGNNENFYGAEFSPDNSKLYVSNFNLQKIYQYNLLSSNIANSKKCINTGGGPAGGVTSWYR